MVRLEHKKAQRTQNLLLTSRLGICIFSRLGLEGSEIREPSFTNKLHYRLSNSFELPVAFLGRFFY